MKKSDLERHLAEGMSLAAIGRKEGKHLSTVAYWLRQHGLIANGARTFSPSTGIKREQLEPLVMDGLTLHEIATRLDCSVSTVGYWISRHGLPTPIEVRRGARSTEDERRLGTAIRTCQHHGETAFVVAGSGRMRCRKCRMEAVNRRRRKVKQILVQEAGGRCVICGYDRFAGALQFHHTEPEKKEFGLAQAGVARSLDRAREEARKCRLLCANCHAEVEAGVSALP